MSDYHRTQTESSSVYGNQGYSSLEPGSPPLRASKHNQYSEMVEGATVDQSTINSSQLMHQNTPQPKKMVAKSLKQSPFNFTGETHHK